MPRSMTQTLHKWIIGFMVGVLLMSVLVWFVTRDTLPKTIRIATGERGGLYYELAETLGEALSESTGRPTEILETRGSVENHTLLTTGQADLAILQGGSVSSKGITIVAPLYSENLHLIVRRDSDIREVQDLRDRTVAMGPEGSGMRQTAFKLLRHYGLESGVVESPNHYFTSMRTNNTIEAAFVTTGILNQDLKSLLKDGGFRLIPVNDAAAIELKDAFLHQSVIPRGLYRENPAVPAEDIKTIATVSFLAMGSQPSARLMELVLISLHEKELPLRFPILIPHTHAIERAPTPLHPVARQYFNPPDHIGLLANILESVAAVKELLFALAAGCFLVWERYRRLEEEERLESIQAQKDFLDQFLKQTLVIEEAQMCTTNPEELKQYLDEVTCIKLQALKELTDEELRSDQAFTIFIMQCANLISKIQFKILMARELAKTESECDLRTNDSKRSKG